MNKDYKLFSKGMLILFITGVLYIKLPHTDYSLSQIILPPIKISKGSRLYLSGFIIVGGVWWAYKHIVKSDVFKLHKHGIIILMAVFVPWLFNNMDMIMRPYYWLSKDLGSMEVVEARFEFKPNKELEGQDYVHMEIEYWNYGLEGKTFKTKIQIPDCLNALLEENTYDDGIYHTLRKGSRLKISGAFPLDYKEGYSYIDLFDTHFSYEDFFVILENKDEVLKVRKKMNDTIW